MWIPGTTVTSGTTPARTATPMLVRNATIRRTVGSANGDSFIRLRSCDGFISGQRAVAVSSPRRPVLPEEHSTRKCTARVCLEGWWVAQARTGDLYRVKSTLWLRPGASQTSVYRRFFCVVDDQHLNRHFLGMQS